MRFRSLVLLLALASSPVLAREPALGFYIGGAVGQSNFRGDYAQQVQNAYANSSFTVNSASLTDDKDTAWKGYVGWRFHPYFAVEAGWLDFGEARSHYEIGVPN